MPADTAATARPWIVHDFTDAVQQCGHTPSPGDVTVSCDHPATINVASMGPALTASPEEARANARLIVRAVNSHDELVAALRDLIAAYDRALVLAPVDTALEDARAALSRAEASDA